MTNAKNIYLVGPMGVGKTTIGKALAKNLTLDFVDSDFEIEQRTGVTISTIFDIEGEDGFRNREIRMVTELAERKGIVLATGGGAVESEDVRKALRHNGLVVYLHASIDMQMDRTRNSKNRPLLNTGANRREVLEQLMEEREPLYRQEADVIYETDGRSPQTAAREIAEEVRKLWQY
jgi:shikimate kinase